MSQSQQQMQFTDIQEEGIRISINLPYIKGTSEKLWHILRSHKIKSTFYNKNTLHKLQVATENKNNFTYEVDCSNCEAVYFSESKQFLKLCSDEHKRSTRNSNCEKNEIVKHFWEVCHNLKKKKNFMAPFYGWGSTDSRPEPLQGGSLLFS